MSLPFRDRPFIGDALDFHRRDAQHDASGWMLCPVCGSECNTADESCDVCDASLVDDPNDTDDILAGDFDLAGEHGINEVW